MDRLLPVLRARARYSRLKTCSRAVEIQYVSTREPRVHVFCAFNHLNLYCSDQWLVSADFSEGCPKRQEAHEHVFRNVR